MQVPAPVEYERAHSVEHAIGLLGRLGDQARIIAGGHSLIPMMKLRLVAVEYLIDINDLTELDYIEVEANQVRIGALTRHRALLESTVLAENFPIFADAERVIADPPVRNRGTLGGALCQADPSEDLSSVCTTLNARCVITGPRGPRTVSMEEFYQGPYQTAVGTGEMLTEVQVPILRGGSNAYAKVDRRAGDWAVVAVGAALWLRRGLIRDARVGLAAVGPNTTGIPAISAALAGQPPSPEAFTAAGEIAADACTPTSDARGSAAYKRHLVAALTARTLQTAADRIVAASKAGG